MTILETLDELIEDGAITTLAHVIEAMILSDAPDAEELYSASMVAAQQGLTRLAARGLARVMELRPDHADAREELEQLREEARSAASAVVDDDGVTDDGAAFTDDVSRADLARMLALFAGRRDVHARQWYQRGEGAGYSPVHQPLTLQHLRQHVDGEITVGVYPVCADGTCGFFALDLDITAEALRAASGSREETARLIELVKTQTIELVERCELELGLEPLVEDSGFKGRHLWFFLAEAHSAQTVHRIATWMARLLAPAAGALAIEAFPRQGVVAPGKLGNLIKLPLGIHRRSGRRAALLDDAQRPARDPWGLLRRAQRIAPAHVDWLLAQSQAVSVGGATLTATVAPTDTATARAATKAPFTIEDLAQTEGLDRLRAGCAVLDEVVSAATRGEPLSHDERVVMRHTLGHVPRLIPALNYMIERAVPGRAFELVRNPQRGNPMSCASVRRRVPDIAYRVPCYCAFEDVPREYPTPLLHLACGDVDVLAPEEEEVLEEPSAGELAQTYTRLRARIDALRAELDGVREVLVERIGEGEEVRTDAGVLRVEAVGAERVLCFTRGEEE